MEARIIKPNGEVLLTSPANGKSFSFQELREIVGGWVDVVNVSDDEYVFFNEEGEKLNLPENHSATAECKSKGSMFRGRFYGNVLICGVKHIFNDIKKKKEMVRYRKFQIFNFIVSSLLVVTLMILCYKNWSVYGWHGLMSAIYLAVFTIPWGFFFYAILNHFYVKFKGMED